VGEDEPPQSPGETGAIGDVAFQIATTFSDEVIAHMGGAIRSRAVFRGLSRTLDRPQDYAQLSFSRTLGQRLRGLSVAVPTQEVHAPVDPRRVPRQNLLHQTHCLEVLAPIERGREAKASDRVSDRDLGRGQSLMLGPDGVLGAHSLRRQVLGDGGAHRREARAVLAHTLEELHNEGGMQHGGERPRPSISVSVDPGHVGIRGTARLAGVERLLGQPPEVLDERELHHARPCP
jgi:hypothetical protein